MNILEKKKENNGGIPALIALALILIIGLLIVGVVGITVVKLLSLYYYWIFR